MADLSNVLLILAGLVIFAVWFLNRWYSYWTRLGVMQLNPKFFIGNMVADELGGVTYTKLYNEFKKRGVKYGGIYTSFRRDFLPVDVNLLKNIMQNDFVHFQSKGSFNHEKDVLSQQLLNMWGDKWKGQRSSLTPTFSSGKIKLMYENISQKCINLLQQTEKLAASNAPIDAKELMQRYTTDVILSAAFGVEGESLHSPEKNGFQKVNQQIFNFNLWDLFGMLFLEKIFPWSILGNLGYKSLGYKKYEGFFVDFVKKVAESRKAHNIERNDFFNCLLKMKNKDFGGDGKNGLVGITDAEMVAQSFLFFTAGHKSTATTVSFALLNAALQPDLQEKCRQEIREVLKKHDGKMTYEAAQELVYCDQFIQETLRIHPPFADTLRECTKDYRVPDSDLIIKKGTKVIVPILAINMNPDLYPNPSKFNPDNFSKENKQKRPDGSFLTFGNGPRMCLGFRFGILNAKSAFATLVNNFEVTLNSRTKLPIELESNQMASTPKGGIWVDLKKLDRR